MRISLFNSLTLGALSLIAVLSGTLTLWHSRQSVFWDGRIALAQASLAEHLSLEGNIARLFKQHGDALLFGDRDDGAGEADIEVAIAANLAAIRHIIAREIDLVGEEEIEELDLLARIETKVGALTSALSRFAEDGTPLGDTVRRSQLVTLMDDEVDVRLARIIAEAIEGERAEVADVLAEAEAFRTRVQGAVWALIAASLGVAALSGVLYHRQVALPARAIAGLASRYQSGDFSRAPAVGGVRELRAIGDVLGRMAERLRERQLTQDEQTHALEAAVTARTSELSHALAQIERSELSRRQLMADVSHELRTPLTIIQGEADVSLRTGPHGADIYIDSLARIRDTSRHANAIVDDLMLIARQEAGKLRLDLTEIDLADLARRAADLTGRPIAVETPPREARVKADPVRIRQSLLALLQNALRYGGTEVTVRVTATSTGYRLAVEDNGPGMSDSEKATAFDRFFRGTNAAAPEVDGTGLGLPIVRSIAVAHGGAAGLDDRPGGGLCAWIDLPVDRGLRLVGGGDAAQRRN